MPSRCRAGGQRSKHAVAGLALLTFLAVVAFLVLSFFSPRHTSTEERSAASGRRTEVMAGRPKVTTRGQEASLPTTTQVRRARVFARSRSGVVSFAVVDTSGRLRCYRCWEPYVAASVVKAMLLVAYLNYIAEANQPLTSSHRTFLAAMIRVSDNSSATAIYRDVGDAGLYRLAKDAGMRRFDVFGDWASAQITAADQGRFFAQIDRLTPARYRGYARQLLSSIVPSQAWGIPEVSRVRWKTFFKGGWRETSLGQLVHQVARLENRRGSMAIAVLTDGNPDGAYGRATIRGIAARLLRS